MMKGLLETGKSGQAIKPNELYVNLKHKKIASSDGKISPSEDTISIIDNS
ncbi:hypothetical protein [Sphingobacterium bambusae]